ncbi:hypothetical protein EYF80_053651 [Liparis tanakae]|uniref:Uncharacterized protein n=1 Tax=Liparis tanakae TaxID=230148 RepID=A0A4Z2F5T2_9TELE|nr:hypothetical protein EYF80_053651 [Liparis tanakae]
MMRMPPSLKWDHVKKELEGFAAMARPLLKRLFLGPLTPTRFSDPVLRPGPHVTPFFSPSFAG